VVKRNGGFKSATCDPNWFDILKKGGTADAAIAVNAALGLMEPTGSGVGGDLLRLYGMLKRKNCMD
jgi:gamma-glutamyltranspeptidase